MGELEITLQQHFSRLDLFHRKNRSREKDHGQRGTGNTGTLLSNPISSEPLAVLGCFTEAAMGDVAGTSQLGSRGCVSKPSSGWRVIGPVRGNVDSAVMFSLLLICTKNVNDFNCGVGLMHHVNDFI